MQLNLWDRRRGVLVKEEDEAHDLCSYMQEETADIQLSGPLTTPPPLTPPLKLKLKAYYS